MAAEEELEGGDDSLGSLKDLDLLDVGAMGDKGLQDIIKDNEDIIKEVMNEQDGNEENVPPPVTVNIKKMEPKVVIQFLAPKKKSPQKKRPGPGRPRKNKVNILKQSKTTANKKSSPPQNSESELRVRTDMLDGPHKLPPPMRVQLTEAQIVDILQDATGIPTSVIQTSLPPPVIEDPPTVDKPRQFPELDAAEAAYIGDMDRAWRVMEELGMRETQDKQLQLQYLKRLDDWGGEKSGGGPQFSFDPTEAEMKRLGVPEDWKDDELFAYLGSRAETESVFLNTWLPKLDIRRANYRAPSRFMKKKRSTI